MVPSLGRLSYPESLKKLQLPTLAYRRMRGDMIEVYKMLSGMYDKEVPGILPLQSESVQRQGGRGALASNCTTRDGAKELEENFIQSVLQGCGTVFPVQSWRHHP